LPDRIRLGYVLSGLSERLRMEKERMEKEMAHDALEDGIEMEAISPTHSQPLEGYDVLEDEI